LEAPEPLDWMLPVHTRPDLRLTYVMAMVTTITRHVAQPRSSVNASSGNRLLFSAQISLAGPPQHKEEDPGLPNAQIPNIGVEREAGTYPQEFRFMY
jgi:hypothetical protein